MKTIMLVVVTAMLSGCVTVAEEKRPVKFAMSNPAAEYCQTHGGNSLLMRNIDGKITSYCLFKDGAMCEESAFFRGECQPVEPVFFD